MKLDAVTDGILKKIDDYGFKQEGAYNLRTTARPSAMEIRITSRSAGRRTSRESTYTSVRKRREKRCIFLWW